MFAVSQLVLLPTKRVKSECGASPRFTRCFHKAHTLLLLSTCFCRGYCYDTPVVETATPNIDMLPDGPARCLSLGGEDNNIYPLFCLTPLTRFILVIFCSATGCIVQAFSSDMADTVEGVKLLVRPRLILVDLSMANNQALFEMVVAPLIEGGNPIEFR